MIKKIRLMLEYNTYCIWLYNEDDEIIDNNNPPEWDDQQLTDAFMAISDLYDTFFIDNKKEFRYVGCPDDATRQELIKRIDYAIKLLDEKNNGKYVIVNDIETSF